MVKGGKKDRENEPRRDEQTQTKKKTRRGVQLGKEHTFSSSIDPKGKVLWLRYDSPPRLK